MIISYFNLLVSTGSCLYGDQEGQIFSNQPWNCSDIANSYSYNCPAVPIKCCDSCAPYLPSTTTITTASGSTGHGSTMMPTTSGSGSTVAPQSSSSLVSVATTSVVTDLSDADAQCESIRGSGSFMCRVYRYCRSSLLRTIIYNVFNNREVREWSVQILK